MHHQTNSPMVMHSKGHQSTNSRFIHKNGFHNQDPSSLNQCFNFSYTGIPISMMGFDMPTLRSPGYAHSVRGRFPSRPGWHGRSLPLESQYVGYNMRQAINGDTYLRSPNYTIKPDTWIKNTMGSSSRGLTSGNSDSSSSCDSSNCLSAATPKYQPLVCSPPGQHMYPKGVQVTIGSSKSSETEQHFLPGPGSVHQHIHKTQDSEHDRYRSQNKSPLKHSKKLPLAPLPQQQRPGSKPFYRQCNRSGLQEYIGAFRTNGYKWPVNGVSTVVPDHFLNTRSYKEVKNPPLRLCTGGEWDKLSEGIWNKFMLHQQTESTFSHKVLLWKRLSAMIRSKFPEYSLFLVGSTMTGFGCNKSDVDMCLLVRQSHMDQRSEAVVHLEKIMYFLNDCEFVLDPTMIQAKVPILKFRDHQQGFEIDLNCNNCVGIRNTHLMYCYEQMDWRVRPLVLLVKLWAHAQNINDAKNMTISSYSLTLMVIHFLQCGVSPPVLPCLHTLYDDKFLPSSDVATINIHEQLDHVFSSTNEQALGELLYSFLHYYVHFDYNQFAISVRLGTKVAVEECRAAYKYDIHQWKCLCIEEPFDLSNTARSVYDPEVFEVIKKVFALSLANLEESRSVDSIFRVTRSESG